MIASFQNNVMCRGEGASSAGSPGKRPWPPDRAGQPRFTIVDVATFRRGTGADARCTPGGLNSSLYKTISNKGCHEIVSCLYSERTWAAFGKLVTRQPGRALHQLLLAEWH